MKRAIAIMAAVISPAAATIAVGAAQQPATAQVASAVAGHQSRITELVDLEGSCGTVECYFANARLDRAENLARESLALHDELEDLAGKNAKRAPRRIRTLTRTTMQHADDIADEYEIWVTCLNANDGLLAACTAYEERFAELRDGWPALIDRWAPYL